jgi:hypothetical protein
MIIGVSGPQGSGKSTLLAALQDKGWLVDPYKASRQVQAEMEVLNLLDAINTPQGMMLFQERVLEQKIKNLKLMKEQVSHGEYLLTERTFADISAYAMLWAFDLVDQRKWALSSALTFTSKFGQRCADAQNEWFDVVFHLPRMPHIIEENDPHRAPAKMVDFIDEQLLAFYAMKQKNIRTHTLSAVTVADRVKQLEYYITLQ